MQPADKASRFNDLAIGDRVRQAGCSSHIFGGEALVISIRGDDLTVQTKPVGYREMPKMVEVKRANVTFACHHETAPFTRYEHDADSGYKDGFQTGRNWNRARWNHNPGGPYKASDLGHRGTNECRHHKAYNKATEKHHAAWMRGFFAGEAGREKLPFDPNLPLELDTGHPVKLISVSPDGHHALVELPDDAFFAFRRGEATGDRRKVFAHTKSAVLMHNHAFYLRNRTPDMPFIARSEYMLVSASHADARRFPDLNAVSTAYHESNGAYSIIKIDLGSMKEGGLLVPVGCSIVKPAPNRQVLYTKVDPTSGNRLRPLGVPRVGDNLKLTFEDGKLIASEPYNG